MRNFYTDVLLRSPVFNSPVAVKDLLYLEPITRAAVQAIITESKALGISLFVTETYRSEARQKILCAQGATKLRTVGVHHYGLAVDFAKLIDGKASWDGDWSFLRDLAEKHGLISGLDWGEPNIRHSFVDPDHAQRCSLDMQGALFSGTWYPSETRNPPAPLVVT